MSFWSGARRKGSAGVGALLLALVAGTALGGREDVQEPAPAQPTFRTGVDLVRVDVTVAGRGDETVADLQASDFEVREDKMLQAIESFQFVRLDGETRPGDDTSLTIRSRDHGRTEAARDDVRVFAVFLDDYHISDDLATNLRLRTALEAWIQNDIKPTDIVVLMDPLLPISAVEYSRSKPELIERIKKFKGREGVYMPVRSALEEGQLQTRNPRRLRAEVTLSALNAIVTHLGALRERRTSVIFVSHGPPLRFNDAFLENYMRDVVESANRFNVTINTLDPAGLTTGYARDVLWRLSAETGGRAIVNTNGLLEGMKDVTRDASAYYLLGYTPPRTEGDGKFHEIEVKVNRRGTRVLARKGYWAPSAKEMQTTAPAAPPEITRALAAFSQFSVGRRASTWIGFEPGERGRTVVRLAWQPRARGTEAEAVETLVLSAKRDAATVVPDTRVQLSQTPSSPGRSAEVRLDVPPGELRLSIVAETKGGEVVDRWVETLRVPEFEGDKAVLTTPWLLLARSVQEYRALRSGIRDAVPSPMREFRRTDRVILCATRSGAPTTAPITVSLLTNKGSELVKLPAPDATLEPIQVEIPLASLAAGEYVVRIATAETDADASSAHYVAFRVVS